MKSIGLLKLSSFFSAFPYLTPVIVTGDRLKVFGNYTLNAYLKRAIFSLLIALSISSCGFSQNSTTETEQDAAYTRTINQRADKIVAALNISDAAKATRVRDIIANQYRSLNEIHTNRDLKVKAAKASTNAEGVNAQVTSIQDEAKGKLDKLHANYLKNLASELTPQQVDQVKDGMTYGVVGITYKGYQDMIPTLTEEQKKQILAWLIEARELAMDAETSDKKHAWFGKYKGRINNYLSAAGYDLKKEGEEWEKRRKANDAAKKGQ